MSRKHQNATPYNLKRTEQLFTRVFRNDAWISQGKKCAYCFRTVSSEKEITADHLRSRSLGGSTERKNIKAACFRCNQLKGHLSEDQFKRMIDAKSVPVTWEVTQLWIDRRIGKRLDQSLRRLCKYAGVPPENAA